MNTLLNLLLVAFVLLVYGWCVLGCHVINVVDYEKCVEPADIPDEHDYVEFTKVTKFTKLMNSEDMKCEMTPLLSDVCV